MAFDERCSFVQFGSLQRTMRFFLPSRLLEWEDGAVLVSEVAVAALAAAFALILCPESALATVA
jgi:hypothetical protein